MLESCNCGSLYNESTISGSLVSPKVIKSVHFCPKTKKTSDRRYTDMTSLNAFPSSTVYPTRDEDGNPLETEYGLSVYKDHQTFTIQVSERLLAYMFIFCLFLI